MSRTTSLTETNSFNNSLSHDSTRDRLKVVKGAIDPPISFSPSLYGIDQQHWDEWKASGVSPEIISANIRSYSGQTALEIVTEVAIAKAQRVESYLTEPAKKILKRNENVTDGGWYVTGIDPLNNWERMEWGQFKPNTPRLDKKGKPVKYQSPESCEARAIFLDIPSQPDYWAKVAADVTIPVYVCEGAKKAGLGLSLGYAAIAVPGIWMAGRWRDKHGKLLHPHLIPELLPFVQPGRLFIFVYDQDEKLKTQEAAAAAIARTAKLMEAQGCEVLSTRWSPAEGKGLDDLWANKGADRVHEVITAAAPVPAGQAGVGFGSAPSAGELAEPDLIEYAQAIAQQESLEQSDEASHNQSLLDRVLSVFRPRKERKSARERVEPIAVATAEAIVYEPGLLPTTGAEDFRWIAEPNQQRTFIYEAIAKGYRHLLNASSTGAGKSHQVGLLNPERLVFPNPEADGGETEAERTSGEEGRSTGGSIWYMSQRSRMPSTSTIEENFTIMPTRHQGLEETGEVTPLGDRVLKTVINPDMRHAGNCHLAHLFIAAGEKNYGSGGEAESNPICGKCIFGQVKDGVTKCGSEKGEGYGFRYERRVAMGKSTISLNPQSAPAEMPEGALAVFEEVGTLMQPRTIRAGLTDFNAETANLSDLELELESKIRPILKAMRLVLGGGGDSRWGTTSTDLVAQPEVAAALSELSEDDRWDILDELEPILKKDLSAVLAVEAFDNSAEGKKVRSLQLKAKTANRRVIKAQAEADNIEAEVERQGKATLTKLGGILLSVPTLEALKSMPITGIERAMIKSYWRLVSRFEPADAARRDLERAAIELNTEFEAVRAEYEKLKESTKKIRGALVADAFDKLTKRHTQALWDALRIIFFLGSGCGEFRLSNDSLTLTLPDNRIKGISRSTAANLHMDATVNPEILKNQLGIKNLLVFEARQPKVENIQNFQVNGFGKCGRNRADSTNDRLHALHEGIRVRAEEVLGTSAFEMETCDYKNQREEFKAKLGHLQNTRGSNEIKGAQVLILHGLPKPNLGAVHDEFKTLQKPSFTVEQYYQMKCDEEIQQLGGRPRAALYPEKQFLIFWVTEEELPFEVEKLEAEDISEAAGKRSERELRALTRLVQDWYKDNGLFPTQECCAQLMGCTQGWISKLTAKLKGGWRTLKRIVAGLIAPPRILDDIITMDELFVATEMMPAIALATPEEVASEINIVIKSFGLSGWSRILRATPKKIRFNILAALIQEGGDRIDQVGMEAA